SSISGSGGPSVHSHAFIELHDQLLLTYKSPASERLTGLDWRAEDTLPAHRDRLSLPSPEQLA
ncbi:TPA: hypothetical protein ACP32N_006639, partial [Pseudomonas aeruginosa]